MSEVAAVSPVVTGIERSHRGLVVSVGGLGSGGGLTVSVGAKGFEVLGHCSSGNTTLLCWEDSPISSANSTAIVLAKVPIEPQALRYLWWIAPVGVHPYQAPVYAKVKPLGSLSGEEQSFVPLGPFIWSMSA